MSPEREALWSRVDKATFLTQNEKRAAVGYGPHYEILAQKFNPNHDERGRFTFGPSPDAAQSASRRRYGRGQGTPAQEARLAAAEARAREATRQLRELEPTWNGPRSLTDPDSIEGRIAHQEATAEAAEARLAEILRDAIPGTNPSWGVNRLVKELHDQGYVLKAPTNSPGLLYRNEETGEEVRIMERPPWRYPSDPEEKFTFRHYYRYRPGRGEKERDHVPIPDKD